MRDIERDRQQPFAEFGVQAGKAIAASAAAITRCPLRAKTRAISSPKPALAPVTRTIIMNSARSERSGGGRCGNQCSDGTVGVLSQRHWPFDCLSMAPSISACCAHLIAGQDDAQAAMRERGLFDDTRGLRCCTGRVKLNHRFPGRASSRR